MTRQHALNKIWKRLFFVLCVTLAGGFAAFYLEHSGKDVPANTAILVFLVGNIGGYVSVHRSLGDLSDVDVVELSSSWWSIIVPSFVGGVLALAMYFLFLSGILGAGLFPKFLQHVDINNKCPETPEIGVLSLRCQYAETMADYAKLVFWSFVAGFNQKYVVDIINSVKAKP